MIAHLLVKAFNESDHPRADDGKFGAGVHAAHAEAKAKHEAARKAMEEAREALNASREERKAAYDEARASAKESMEAVVESYQTASDAFDRLGDGGDPVAALGDALTEWEEATTYKENRTALAAVKAAMPEAKAVFPDDKPSRQLLFDIGEAVNDAERHLDDYRQYATEARVIRDGPKTKGWHPWLAGVFVTKAGRWVTMGAHAGDDGEKTGGTPVFIENGKITRGPAKLMGKNPGDMKAEAEDGTHRRQMGQSRSHAKASIRRQARKAGHDLESLDALAADRMAAHNDHVGSRKEMLSHARESSKSRGFGDLRTVAARAGRGDIDANSLKGFDQVAGDVAGKFPEHFKDEDDHGSHADQLFSMLSEGDPEPMTEEEAYQAAFDEMEADKGEGKADDSDSWTPWDDDGRIKGLAGYHPWLVRKAGRWDESRHDRDHGRFSSSPGARGQASKPAAGQPAASRPNDLLDEAMAAGSAKPAKPATDSPSRPNPLLDEAMGGQGDAGSEHHAYAKRLGTAAAKASSDAVLNRGLQRRLASAHPAVQQAFAQQAGLTESDTPAEVASKVRAAFGGNNPAASNKTERTARRPKRLNIRKVESAGTDHYRKANAAAKAGDEETEWRHQLAGYGHFLAAKHTDDGEHDKAAKALAAAEAWGNGTRPVPPRREGMPAKAAAKVAVESQASKPAAADKTEPRPVSVGKTPARLAKPGDHHRGGIVVPRKPQANPPPLPVKRPPSTPPSLPHKRTEAGAVQAANALRAAVRSGDAGKIKAAHAAATSAIDAHRKAGHAAIARMATAAHGDTPKARQVAERTRQAFEAKLQRATERLGALAGGKVAKSLDTFDIALPRGMFAGWHPWLAGAA